MNIASGQEMEIMQMAEMVNALTDNKAGCVHRDRRKWDTKSRLRASIDKAKDLLGYAPRMTFEDGLQDTIRWFADHWEEINRDAEFPRHLLSGLGARGLERRECFKLL